MEKNCIACAELIKYEARLCRYCNTLQDDPRFTTNPERPEASNSEISSPNHIVEETVDCDHCGKLAQYPSIGCSNCGAKLAAASKKAATPVVANWARDQTPINANEEVRIRERKKKRKLGLPIGISLALAAGVIYAFSQTAQTADAPSLEDIQTHCQDLAGQAIREATGFTNDYIFMHVATQPATATFSDDYSGTANGIWNGQLADGNGAVTGTYTCEIDPGGKTIMQTPEYTFDF